MMAAVVTGERTRSPALLIENMVPSMVCGLLVEIVLPEMTMAGASDGSTVRVWSWLVIVVGVGREGRGIVIAGRRVGTGRRESGAEGWTGLPPRAPIMISAILGVVVGGSGGDDGCER